MAVFFSSGHARVHCCSWMERRQGKWKRAVGGDSGPIPAKICSSGKDPADDRKAPGTERERKGCWLSQGTSDLVGAE